jgi:hypothetical protein
MAVKVLGKGLLKTFGGKKENKILYGDVTFDVGFEVNSI